MNVTFAAVEPRRDFQPRHQGSGFQVARLSRRYLCVARLLQQNRQPADLEFQPGADQQVGVARSGDQAGPGFDPVRVLQRGSGGIDVRFFAGKLLGERRPFRFAGEHIEGCVGWEGE